MKNVKKDIRFRVYVTFTAICLFGLLILWKAADIQAREGKELRAIARDLHLRADTLSAERGSILTEDGHMLCASIPEFDVFLDLSIVPKDTFNKYIDTLSKGIAGILGKESAAGYKKKLTEVHNQKKRYFRLGRSIAYDQFQALRELPLFNKGRRRGGFIAESRIKRVNPYGMLAYRTIGLYREHAQMVGLESRYDSVLSGQKGSRILQKMTGGVMMPVEGTEIEPRNGRDVVTTLDLSIQTVAQDALMSYLQKYECLNGTAIVMEVSTGKIKGLVNLGRQKDGSYAEDYNYALTRAEPGSTFKLTTLYALLSDGYINVNNNVNCEGGAHAFPTRVMHDSHHGLGVMPIREAFAHSSNVAMGKLAYEHYAKDPEKYMKHLEEMGVDIKTGIDLNGETAPSVIKPGTKHWKTAATLPWMATGYGVLITPMRTCMLYNAVANDGKLMRPYLISAIKENGRVVKTIEPKVLKTLGDSNVIAQLKLCTREVVVSGTGKSIASPFYNISGKTGTAQVADMINGRWYGYKDRVYQGSFVGYFPSEAPKYTIMVMVRTKPGGGTIYGGSLAAPVFRMIADRIFSGGLGTWTGPLDSFARVNKKAISGEKAPGALYNTLLQQLGIRAGGTVDGGYMASLQADTTHRTVAVAKAPVYEGQVPDVTNMNLRDAVYLLERAGLKVRVNGKGRIKSQSIAPGQQPAKGQFIDLYLS